MPLLLKNDGKINSAGNIVHISGLSWCGGYNQNPKQYIKQQEVQHLSGACLMIRRSVLKRAGGMPEGYFMYYEDAALSSQLNLMGLKLGIVPKAHVVHEYDYAKSTMKWFYIERNRYLYVITVWPLLVIALLLPYLILVEAGLWAVSTIEGRFLSKIKASASFVKMVPEAIKIRRTVQKRKTITTYKFLLSLSPVLNTLQLGSKSKFSAVNAVSKFYYGVLKALLKFSK